MTHISNAGLPHEPHEPGVDLRWPASAIWRPGEPAVRRIGFSDLKDAVVKGIADFNAAPTHALFLCLIYPIVGLVLFRIAFGYHLLPLVYPLIAGFALIGPMVAVGLYELSRRREQGLDVSAWHVVEAYRGPYMGAVLRLGVVLLAIFVAWLLLAQELYSQSFGGEGPTSISQFVNQIFYTPAGHQIIFAGNLIGFFFAALVLVISVVSFPMLVDRDGSVGTAVRASVRAAMANPLEIAAWGLLVALALLVGALPFFFGLAVVFPVLGHSTWHLYRKLVSPDEVI